MKRIFEEGIVVDVDDSTGKRKCKVALTIHGKDSKGNWRVITDWIRPYQPAFGAGSEGIYSRLGVDDYVIVSFLDYPVCQKPIIILKDTTNDADNIEVTDDKIIKFNNAKIIFKADKSIEFESDGDFSDIEINGLSLLDWLQDMFTHLTGNLGYNVVPDPTIFAKLTSAISLKGKIIFKK
jgi:hypothetical protein